MKFSKKVIIGILAAAAMFTVAMTIAFFLYQSVPGDLVTGFYAFCGAEAGVLGWIKRSGL